MKKVICDYPSTSSEKVSYFDMSGKNPWPAEEEVWRGPPGRGFRIGDRAAAYVRILDWRRTHPDEYLIILDDINLPEVAWAKELDAYLIFKNLANEVWFIDKMADVTLPDKATPLYVDSLWIYWNKLRYFKPQGIQPHLELPTENLTFSKKFLQLEGLQDYICVQPLIDAQYNTGRNQTATWWCDLINSLSDFSPVVVLGDPNVTRNLKFTKRVARADYAELSILSSLAVIFQSRLFVGGETGLTLWAPLLNTPTVGVMNHAAASFRYDTAPLSFGAPVACFPIELDIPNLSPLIYKFAIENYL